MIRGTVVTAVVAVGAMLAVLVAFAANQSPYMTMREAKITQQDNVHLAGDLVKDSVRNDIETHTLQFKLRDSEGTVVNVHFHGEVPANMAEATKVVAIGHVQGEDFTSDKLLVKCPSKYEEQPKQGDPSQPSNTANPA